VHLGRRRALQCLEIIGGREDDLAVFHIEHEDRVRYGAVDRRLRNAGIDAPNVQFGRRQSAKPNQDVVRFCGLQNFLRY
jgi:hypothetical protein